MKLFLLEVKPIGRLSAPQLTHASIGDSERQNASDPGVLSTFFERPSRYTIHLIARIVISTKVVNNISHTCMDREECQTSIVALLASQ